MMWKMRTFTNPLMNIALRWIKYPINYNYLIFTILIIACWLYTSTNTHVAAKIGKSSSTLLHLSIVNTLENEVSICFNDRLTTCINIYQYLSICINIYQYLSIIISQNKMSYSSCGWKKIRSIETRATHPSRRGRWFHCLGPGDESTWGFPYGDFHRKMEVYPLVN